MTKRKPKRRSSRPPPPKGTKGPKSGRPSAAPAGQVRRQAIRGALLSLSAAFAVALVGYTAVVLGYGSARGPGPGREVSLDWPRGLSPEAAAERLSAAGLVGSPRWFALYLYAVGGAEVLHPGAHLLTDDLSPRSLVGRMQRSLAGEHARLTIPEGLNRFDIAKRLQTTKICGARSFLDQTTDKVLLSELAITGDSAEGFLFPATYDLPLDSEPRDVVSRFKMEFDKRFAKIREAHADGLDALDRSLGWKVAEVVTLASIIEKEAAVDDERPVIASVFLNRLRDIGFTPKRLQSDPTAGYGCLVAPELAPSCRVYSGKITHDINADDGNPYSTYRHDGLPPGPISNPGEKSLEAVLAPADSHFYYFVARGEGRHNFSETYAQHADAIRRGRSP